MKLKYYLRGLGIGIVVTAIIMSFSRQPEKLTDAQIKMRALELGMVEESVLTDLQKDKDEQKDIPSFEDIVDEESLPDNEENTAETEEEIETEPVNEDESVSSDEVSSPIEDENVPSDEVSSPIEDENVPSDEVSSPIEGENTERENDAEESVEEVVENYIVISIEAGNGSEIVSQRLYEAGLVNSAKDYNRYLVKNGYDRILKTGHHEIPAKATEEEMAKILCGVN